MKYPPIVPEDYRDNGASIAPLVRAAIAVGLGALDKTARPLEHAKRRFGDDRSLGLVLRSATSPATLAGNPELARVAVAYLEALQPASAGADLLARGIGLNFADAAQISVPGIAVPNADFVGEGQPIPVQMAPTSVGTTLTPHKLAVITSLTGEMMCSSNAETLVRQALIESTGPALDRVLFSAAPAAADRPPGLLNGIAALTPSAGAYGKTELIVDDLQALALGSPASPVMARSS